MNPTDKINAKLERVLLAYEALPKTEKNYHFEEQPDMDIAGTLIDDFRYAAGSTIKNNIDTSSVYAAVKMSKITKEGYDFIEQQHKKRRQHTEQNQQKKRDRWLAVPKAAWRIIAILATAIIVAFAEDIYNLLKTLSGN